MTVWPACSLPTSAADGFWTRSTTSACVYSSAVETTVAPASAYAESGNAEPCAGTRLDEHVHARTDQLADDFGHECDAPLVGRSLLRDGDLHPGTPIR